MSDGALYLICVSLISIMHCFFYFRSERSHHKEWVSLVETNLKLLDSMNAIHKHFFQAISKIESMQYGASSISLSPAPVSGGTTLL
jgi:hypothetical protein